MYKNQLFALTAVCGILTLGSCSQEVINEEMAEPNSRLKVMTRSTGEAEVNYPVRLYVFGSDQKCKAVQTLEQADDAIDIKLPEGSYDVYALGGAEGNRYVLPTASSASKTSVIALQEGQKHGNLMAGHSLVTLSANGSNSLTIGLERKVMLIKGIVITNVPESTGAVSIKIAPLQGEMLLDGSYQGTDNGNTIALTKQSDNTTWAMASSDNYLLPSVGKPTITVTIDNTAYSYTCATELEANHQISIEGTYKPSTSTTPTEITLSGTITGPTWGDEKSISFDFGEGAGENNTSSANIPNTGEIYQGCYVLAVDGNKVTLLSSTQKQNVLIDADLDNQTTIASNIDGALASWGGTVSTNWRLMTDGEAKIIINSYETINSKDIGDKLMNNGYFYIKDNIIYDSPLKNNTLFDNKVKSSTILRPVTTITIQ